MMGDERKKQRVERIFYYIYQKLGSEKYISRRMRSARARDVRVPGEKAMTSRRYRNPDMAALSEQHVYGLASGLASAKLFHVKLTGTALRVLEAHQGGKVRVV